MKQFKSKRGKHGSNKDFPCSTHPGGLHDLWVPLVGGEVARPSPYIANIFHACYIHTDLNHESFIERAADARHIQVVYRDEDSILYRITRP